MARRWRRDALGVLDAASGGGSPPVTPAAARQALRLASNALWHNPRVDVGAVVVATFLVLCAIGLRRLGRDVQFQFWAMLGVYVLGMIGLVALARAPRRMRRLRAYLNHTYVLAIATLALLAMVCGMNVYTHDLAAFRGGYWLA